MSVEPSEVRKLEEFLSLSLEELSRVVQPTLHRQWFEDICVFGRTTTLIRANRCFHLIDPGSDGLESVARIIYEIRFHQTPLHALFLTDHAQHTSGNLIYYRKLAQISPEFFNFRVVSHKDLGLETDSLPVYSVVNPEEFLKLDGRKYLLVQTPGHCPRQDSISILDMEKSVLFVGVLLQPQGESYEFATFLTPLSNHYHPEQVHSSIELLKTLPFDYAITANGELLDRSHTFRWMQITQKTFERTAYWARKILWEDDSKDILENARKVFLNLALERNMQEEPLYQRFSKENGQSAFEVHDLPSIRHFLLKFGMFTQEKE